MQKNLEIPSSYIIEKIYMCARNVKCNDRHIYNFSCPICGEGKSKNRKRRGYYLAKKNYFYCQNCQKSWSPVKWIMEASGISYNQLLCEVSEHDNTISEIIDNDATDSVNTKRKQYTLPYDSINLSDPLQLQYHKNNNEIKHCLKYIRDRRLNTAINKPKNFYISLNDKIHHNRLCIPFYDIDNKIVYYQTRALHKKDADISKYLSKKDSEKTLYGVNKISPDCEYIFIFEGPIDSMFCLNGVAACGLSLSSLQKEQLDRYRMFEKIWVLDNQYDNDNVCEKYKELIENNERVFFWPEAFKGYKDINEVCVASNRDFVSPKLFIDNSYKGMTAQLKLNELCKNS